MRILIIGGTGMLGHKLAQVLGPLEQVMVTLQGESALWPRAVPVAGVIGNVDVRETAQVVRLLDDCHPDVVLNAVGIVKHIMGAHDPVDTVAVNSVFPTLLARFCSDREIRLIHYSTDCVFSGSASSERGPRGYRESDLPDARDLYGMSKLLGEPRPPCLVIRTSMIGRELRGRHGLLEWFLSQDAGPVRGFTRALFTGLTTLELARVTAMILQEHKGMEGLWHVAAVPIDKNALLSLVKACYGRPTVIDPDPDFYCDRRLDGGRFTETTGWKAPSWPQLIAAMHTDELDYATHARSNL